MGSRERRERERQKEREGDAVPQRVAKGVWVRCAELPTCSGHRLSISF